MPFTITAMRSADAAAIREDVAAGRREGRRVVDAEGAPCRHCLRPARAGEAMLLVTYQPFTGEGPYAVPSPVFVHERPCVRHDPNAVAPLLYDGPRAVRSYTEDHDLLEGEVVEGAALDEVLERLLGDDRAAYVHVHSATAGCFTCRVDRSHAP